MNTKEGVASEHHSSWRPECAEMVRTKGSKLRSAKLISSDGVSLHNHRVYDVYLEKISVQIFSSFLVSTEQLVHICII